MLLPSWTARIWDMLMSNCDVASIIDPDPEDLFKDIWEDVHNYYSLYVIVWAYWWSFQERRNWSVLLRTQGKER